MYIRAYLICGLLPALAVNARLHAQTPTFWPSSVAATGRTRVDFTAGMLPEPAGLQQSPPTNSADAVRSASWITPLSISNSASCVQGHQSHSNQSPAPQLVKQQTLFCGSPDYLSPGWVPYDCQWLPAEPRHLPQVRFGPYGWLSEIHGTATVAGITNEVNVGTSDLFDYAGLVDRALFGRLEIDYGSHSILADTYWVGAGFDQELTGFDFSAQFELAIAELALAVPVEGLPDLLTLPPRSRVEFLAGARYWMLDGAGTVTAPGGIFSFRFDGKQDWVDPIIGGRITAPLNAWTTLQLRTDIGGFGWGTASDFTWSAEALFERHWSSRLSTVIGYRILDVDNSRGSGRQQFGWDTQFRGPIFQLVFKL